MKLNTALAIGLLATALRLSLRRAPAVRAARALAGLATAIAAASLLDRRRGRDILLHARRRPAVANDRPDEARDPEGDVWKEPSREFAGLQLAVTARPASCTR